MKELPKHIAIIMDGNGRWGEKRQLSRFSGHRAGSNNTFEIIKACQKRGIKYLTLFAFSTQNWSRPSLEIRGLFRLLYLALHQKLNLLLDLNICIRVIGDINRLHAKLYKKIKEVEVISQNNTGLTVVIAIGYGGQWDIVNAAKALAQQVVAKELTISDITPERFAQYLSLRDLPPPDLCIRTGGECRISNFLLWHLAYSELYFTPTLWPDFDENALDEAIKVYAARDRRFGVLNETNP